MKDRTAFGLTLMNAPLKDDDETLEYVFDDVFRRYTSFGGWGLSEERLYWIDHDERLTELENPKRSFLEVRGIDENWEESGDEGIMRYFGRLVEADYELPLTEDGRMISLHFSLAEEDETSADEKDMSAKEESAKFRYYLRNGYCMDEHYDMTVTDMETGEVLQEDRISLSIELPDTIAYPDLNGDGYADMRVGAPLHSNGSKAKEEGYMSPDYFLWNPQTEEFVWKTEKEVENSRLAVANGLTEEEQEEKTKRERRDPFAPIRTLPEWADPEDHIKLTSDKMLEYEVQEGDSLWRISERFYGTGYKWTEIIRVEDAPEDPNTVLVNTVRYMTASFTDYGGRRPRAGAVAKPPMQARVNGITLIFTICSRRRGSNLGREINKVEKTDMLIAILVINKRNSLENEKSGFIYMIFCAYVKRGRVIV